MKKLNELSDVLASQLQELHGAEKYLQKHLPSLINKIKNTELKRILNQHVDSSKASTGRIEKAFAAMGSPVESHKCNAMEALVERVDDVIKKTTGDNVTAAAFILSEQCINHFEIASYGTFVAFAKTLGQNSVANLLQQSLDEQKSIDKQLTELATKTINVEATTSVGAMVE